MKPSSEVATKAKPATLSEADLKIQKEQAKKQEAEAKLAAQKKEAELKVANEKKAAEEKKKAQE